MRLRIFTGRRWALLLVGALAVAPLPVSTSQAEEPRGLGRLLRLGNNRRDHEPMERSGPPRAAHDHEHAPGGAPATSPFGVVPPSTSGNGSTSPYRDSGGNPYGSSPNAIGAYNPLKNSNEGASANNPPPITNFSGPSTVNPPEGASEGPRLVPQPRVNRAITEADPILTRISIGRSDDGQRFGMFLQVFADGTVLDSEGIHRVGPDALRPLVEALRNADVGRIKGHCGGPPTDFVEQVHLTVYDQSRGRLQANHFTYSGNPAGCDPSIRMLQDAIDAFQARLLGVPPTALSPTPETANEAAPIPPATPTSPVTTPGASAAQPISLTPVN